MPRCLRLLYLGLLLAVIAGVSGCGQKGPLYLPDEARAVPPGRHA